VIYLDASAAAKLIHPEAESAALAVFLVERIAVPLVSSALLHPELVRAVSRFRPELAGRAVALTQRIMTVPLATEAAGALGLPVTAPG
jgi:uncharacterized protein